MTEPTAGSMGILLKWMPFILEGFALNVAISMMAMGLGTIGGFLLGLLRISPHSFWRSSSAAAIQVLQNTPWIVILFATIYLLPSEFSVGGRQFSIPAWCQATFGLSLPIMANVADIVRGAVKSIPLAQWEACESLGFTRGQALRMVIFPQCYKRMLPPWMNWYAILTLATPLAAILGVREALGSAQAATESAGASADLLFPFYGFLMAIFFAYIYPISLWTKRLEVRFAK